MNAMQFAKVGLYVFPSDGKVPLIPRYNRADHALSTADIESAVEEYMEKSGKEPVHVGATRDVDVIKAMWRKFPDAVPSISCGPSKLVVLDADQKDDGPRKMRELFAEIGGVPEGTPINPTKSGGLHFVFADPDGKFSNKAGLLKKTYGTDVRGTGGQFVAPGSIREDGATYGTDQDRIDFLRHIAQRTLKPLPAEIVELIGSQGDTVHEEVAPSKEREVIKQLQDADWDKHEHAFDADVGNFDLDALLASNAELRSLYNAPAADCSTNRFLAARHIMREWPELPVEALSIFFSNWEGSGEYTDDKPKSGQYDDRQIAREWLKNQGLKKEKPSDGSIFEAVVEEDDEGETSASDITPITFGKMFFSTDIVRAIVPDHIIENVCVPGQLGMIHGASNVGKTFTIIHKGESVVGGKKWFGRNVDQSGVLYCFGEGGEGFLNRLDAYRQRYGTHGMVIHDGIPNLGLNTAKAIKELEKAIDRANAMYDEQGRKRTKLVFLDTFAKAIAGAAENDMKEIQPILNALRALARKKGVCIILIHHSGKDTMLGARGSSAIIGDVDFNLEVITETEAKKRKIKGVGAGQLAIIAPKMRDEAKSGLHLFKLEAVDLGVKNKWGNPVTSVVVVPVEPSDGKQFDAVPEMEDEPGDTDDALTPDQNEKADDKRLELLDVIRNAMRGCSSLVGQEMQAKLALIEERVPKLAKLKRISGDNYARELKRLLFRDEPEALMNDGWLRYRPGSGRRPSMLTFTPR